MGVRVRYPSHGTFTFTAIAANTVAYLIGAGSDGAPSPIAGGGAGGGQATKACTLTIGVGYTVSVGQGGTTGGDSWFNTSSTVLAHGAGAASGGTGGTGGPALPLVGDSSRSGGDGGSTGTGNGGQGGSAAGDFTGASGSTPGTSVIRETPGTGGAGGIVFGADGQDGTLPGAGGGGAPGPSGNFGHGADGLCTLIYYHANDTENVDAVSNSGYQSATATPTPWSHTCSGSDRFLSVDVSLLSVAGTTVTGITYNGVALTLIGVQSSITGACRVESWGLIAPATGTNNIAVTLSAAAVSASTAVSRTGVNQTTPTEAFNSAQATNIGAADASVIVTPIAAYCWIHAAIATTDAAISTGFNWNNQVSRNNVTGTLGSGANEDTGIYDAVNPPAAVSVGWPAVGAAKTWAINGYAIRPTSASGGGGASSIVQRRTLSASGTRSGSRGSV